MAILRSFLVLLFAQLVGEGLQRLLHLRLPGPVLGMALLAGWLLFFHDGKPSPALQQTADGLLHWLGLLFVPAGAGVFVYLGMIHSGLLPIVVSLVVSTLLTFAVTAWTMQALDRRKKQAA